MDTNELDPLGLGIDLASVDTSMMVLVDGLYPVNITDIEVKANKNNTGNNLIVSMETTGVATSFDAHEKGEANNVKPGWKLKTWIPLQQSENPDAPDFRKRLAELQDAVDGTNKETRLPGFQPARFVGQQVVVKVKVAVNDGARQNDVGRFMAIPR